MKSEDIIKKVYNAGLKFLVPLTVEDTYKLIVEESINLVGADFGSLILADSEGELKRVYASEPGFYKISNRRRGSMYQVFKKQKIRILNVPHLSNLHPFLKEAKIRSIIAAPLSYRNISIGVLALQSNTPVRFNKDSYNTLQLFTPLATLAIRKTQLYEETKQAIETRDLFISMAAHELRTPLTAVNGYIQLLRNKLTNREEVESRWMEQLYVESVRLTRLVNELLEINRIKSGKLQYFLKECSLKTILERVESTFRFSYPDRKLIVEDKLGQHSDVLIGDFDKILQVFSNLLDNAVKYSASTTPIYLRIKEVGSYFVIQIKDSGIGIKQEEYQKIFEGFNRGSGHDKEGLGLGLFLVKDIVTRLHGSINVYSNIGKGTIMEVKLPKKTSIKKVKDVKY